MSALRQRKLGLLSSCSHWFDVRPTLSESQWGRVERMLGLYGSTQARWDMQTGGPLAIEVNP